MSRIALVIRQVDERIGASPEFRTRAAVTHDYKGG
jgi:hypothetical protein